MKNEELRNSIILFFLSLVHLLELLK